MVVKGQGFLLPPFFVTCYKGLFNDVLTNHLELQRGERFNKVVLDMKKSQNG